jgi:hypothetical protein
MTALERASSNCKRQTGPLVRESAPHQQTRNCLTVINIWSQAPYGCFIPRQTDRLAVGRNIRLRLKNSSFGREPLFKKDLSTEAEKKPLLEAVTRKCSVKTLHARKDLACAVVICKVWKSSIVL